MKKLIAVDVDGTLINSNHELTKRTKETLIKAQQEGHKLVISSGRAPMGVEDLYKELEMDKYEGYISNFNGGLVTDVKTGKIEINHTLDPEKMKEMLLFSKDLYIDYVIYYNNFVYAYTLDMPYLEDILTKSFMPLKFVKNLTEEVDFVPNNILFSQDPSRIEEPAEKIREKFEDYFEFVFSEKFYFEAMPKNVSKGATLLELAEKIGIAKEDVIAFGDQNNDHTMIELAGVGVAMGNAVDSIKEIADYITLTNDEDGIADYVEKNILNQ